MITETIDSIVFGAIIGLAFVGLFDIILDIVLKLRNRRKKE